MNINIVWQPNSLKALMLFVFSLGNFVLMYIANILLAKILKLNEFDDYSVAISVVTLLSTIVTLGLEKYALRVIALYLKRGDWRKLSGFLLFSRAIIAGFGIILFVVLAVSLELVLAWHGADYHIAIVIFAGFLPVIGIALFFVEVISALGKNLLAFAIYRLLLPLLFLSFIIYLNDKFEALSVITAVISFGLAWCIILAVLWIVIKIKLPKTNQRMPAINGKKWLSRSLPLVVSSLLMTIMTNSGVISLELLYPSGIEVGIYAVAAQTGSIINLIGTSTNRYYLPQMVVLLDHDDKLGVTRLIQQRSILIGSFVLVLYIIFAAFGHEILNLFGNKFSGAYLTLIVISAGACFSAFYADIPYYLQYIGLNRFVLSNAIIAVSIMILLSFLLGAEFGAVGVAYAYALPVSCLFLSYRWAMSNHIKIQ